MRPLALILFLFAAVLVSSAEETNYFCVVCGKGPLTGRIWISKWGAVCDDCYKLENRCSLCGLPIRDGDGAVKTGDGRFICKFDKPNTVLDAAEAREVFTDARREMVGLYGSGFTLNFPDVTVNLFDVDYWSEVGRPAQIRLRQHAQDARRRLHARGRDVERPFENRVGGHGGP